MIIVLMIILVYASVLVLEAYAIYSAAGLKPSRSIKGIPLRSEKIPFFWVIAPCHNGAECIPGLVNSYRKQDYPIDRRHLVILLDNCTDNSLEVARKQGIDFYIRNNPALLGKGHALDTFFQERLSQTDVDAAVLLDIDSRIAPDFLSRAACEPRVWTHVLQGSTKARNPMDSGLTRVENLIQSLIRVAQRGRSALTLCPLMIGSHGIIIPRTILEALNWKSTSVRTGDDLELGLQCLLMGKTPHYAHSLVVENELPTHARAIREQRRRWTFSSLELGPHYAPKLLKKFLSGNLVCGDALLNLLLGPSFSILLILLSLLALATLLFSGNSWLLIWAFSVFLSYGLYVYLSLRLDGCRLTIKECLHIPFYIFLRGLAFGESFSLIFSKKWLPTAHKGDTESQ